MPEHFSGFAFTKELTVLSCGSIMDTCTWLAWEQQERQIYLQLGWLFLWVHNCSDFLLSCCILSRIKGFLDIIFNCNTPTWYSTRYSTGIIDSLSLNSNPVTLFFPLLFFKCWIVIVLWQIMCYYNGIFKGVLGMRPLLIRILSFSCNFWKRFSK